MVDSYSRQIRCFKFMALLTQRYPGQAETSVAVSSPILNQQAGREVKCLSFINSNVCDIHDVNSYLCFPLNGSSLQEGTCCDPLGDPGGLVPCCALGLDCLSAVCFLGTAKLFSPFSESKPDGTRAVSDLAHKEDVRTKVWKGIGELFYNAVLWFWGLGLVLKLLALINPYEQQRGPLLVCLGKKKKKLQKVLGRAKIELESPGATEVGIISAQW